jgi:hypothetical protein
MIFWVCTQGRAPRARTADVPAGTTELLEEPTQGTDSGD